VTCAENLFNFMFIETITTDRWHSSLCRAKDFISVLNNLDSRSAAISIPLQILEWDTSDWRNSQIQRF